MCGGGTMEGESIYVNQIKELMLQIQLKIVRQHCDTKDLLVKVARCEYPN